MPETLKFSYLLKILNLVNGSCFIVIHGSQDIQFAQPPITLDQLSSYEQFWIPPDLKADIKLHGSSNFRIQVIQAGPNRKSLTIPRDRLIQELRNAGIPVYNKPRKIPTHMSKLPGYIPNQMWTNNPMRFPKIRDKISKKMKQRVYVRNEKGQIIKHYSREQWDALQGRAGFEALQTSNIPGV